MFKNFQLIFNFLYYHIIEENQKENKSLKEQCTAMMFAMTLWLSSLPDWLPRPRIKVSPEGDIFPKGENRVQRYRVTIHFRIFPRFMGLVKALEPLMVKDTSISKLIKKLIGPLMVKDTSISTKIQSILFTIFESIIKLPDYLEPDSIELDGLEEEPGKDSGFPGVYFGSSENQKESEEEKAA